MEIKGVGMKITKDQPPSSDKKERIQSYVDSDTYNKLALLSSPCKTTVHKLAYDFLKYAVNHPDFVLWIQDKYKVPKDHPFRLVASKVNGEMMYTTINSHTSRT